MMSAVTGHDGDIGVVAPIVTALDEMDLPGLRHLHDGDGDLVEFLAGLFSKSAASTTVQHQVAAVILQHLARRRGTKPSLEVA